MKFILATLLISTSVTVVGAQQLHIGTSADYPPWESVDANGQIVGFDRDVGDEICRRIGATCEWQNQAYDGLLPGLQVGKFDLVISGTSINEERALRVDFSSAYADAPNSMVVASGHEAASTKDASGLIVKLETSAIGVQAGTTHEQVIRAHFPNADVRVYDRPDQIADDLLAGRIDAGLMERSAWGPLVKERGEGKLVFAGPLLTGADFPEFGQGQGIALKKGNNELRTRVNEAIAAMLKDGTVAKLSQSRFGYDLSKK
ncbi:transporter substrate-binding domain-containing protein [Ochrobactrum sp. BTU1]|uniref:transporter substrate-binding domain-containing protein n=1 Tax=Ochrobactrum sp. BTU1 TaxID=2840456 RepID=UPI001C0431AC|nr:transporter substrate-binding domain-containing protein [Ochrobactrum sp. BTU1]